LKAHRAAFIDVGALEGTVRKADAGVRHPGAAPHQVE
jgi:hypothetical protein